MAKKQKKYEVDIELWGIDTMRITASSKPEAKKKAIARLKRSLNKYIQHVYSEEIKD
jgi:hypothetical protein